MRQILQNFMDIHGVAYSFLFRVLNSFDKLMPLPLKSFAEGI